MNFSALARLDRRWIFLALLLVILFPQVVILFPQLGGNRVHPKVVITNEAQSLFDAVDALPEGAPILLSFDFNPGSKAELYPAAQSILRHAFRKKLRVVVMGLWVDGAGMAANLVHTLAIVVGSLNST